MLDPFSLNFLAGAVLATGTSEITKTVVNSGIHWLKETYQGSSDKVIQKATDNTNEFLNQLGEKLKDLEQENKALKAQIGVAFNEPDFIATFRTAMSSAAKTELSEKHNLLSDLITLRIIAGSETTEALAANRAIEVVSYLTGLQIKLLGLYTAFHARERNEGTYYSDEKILKSAFQPYRNLISEEGDKFHLFSMSCLTFTGSLYVGSLTMSKHEVMMYFYPNELKDIKGSKESKETKDAQINDHINSEWLFQILKDARLRRVDLSTIGNMIGQSIHNKISTVKL
ncbi:MAG: hypothetical protein QNL04_06180 [SAR324 cluster bacterium]|nr:hypothetical protein [SAR324 cluster bacterium]